jgi:hypothetical protein
VTRAALALGALVIVMTPSASRGETRAEMWTELGFEAEPVEDLSLSWTNHWRFINGPGQLERWLNDISVGYRFNKVVSGGVGYRLDYRPFGDVPCCRHRFHAQGALRAKLGELRVTMRGRFQTRLQLDKDPRYVVRDRFTAMWRGSKILRPYVSAEVFVRLLDEDFARLDTTRLDVGFSFRGIDHVKLRTFYRFELPGDPEDDTLHIVGLGATAF